MTREEVAQQLSRRRSTVGAAWTAAGQVVLIGAGEPIPMPGHGDLTYPFRAHPEYYYLTDSDRPGGVLTFDPGEGWLHFEAPISASERLWLGTPPDGPTGPTTSELAEWLRSRASAAIAWLGVPLDGAGFDLERTREARFELDAIRRPKDALEIERMRHAERATRAAFAAVVPWLADGVSERRAQIELEAEAFRHGADAMAYETILAGGPNSAALHFAPTSRPMREGELVLIDAGADHLGYASDITRTYPVGGRFATEQQELHSLVRAAELAAIERCAAGIEWREVHLEAARVIAEGLGGCGLLRGEPDALIESGAVGLFFPHGIGHLLGLGVRDAGGILPERRNEPAPFPNLRINLPLAPGMVVTVEPGIYFVRALLQDPEQRRRHRDHVVWDRVDRMLDFGGIRIEDNVLITAEGHEVITADVPLLG
ncbi:MAG: aminopeptidase P family protein [Solirubrobacteraceae bacterium]